MYHSFLADLRLNDSSEVLQIPVLRAKDVKKLAKDVAFKAPLVGPNVLPTVDKTLEEYLQHAGSLFGLDPDKWEQVGVPTTEVTEADGKRTIKKTGIYSGTELHLWMINPHFDDRLPSRPDCPELDFTVQRKEITKTTEWQQAIKDQPWTPAKRRRMLLRFLQAGLQAPSEQLQLEAARGMWELSINKDNHGEMDHSSLSALVQRLCSPNIEVAKTCAAAVWGLAVSSEARQLLLDLGAVDVLVEVARSSLDMPCIDPRVQEVYHADSKTSHDQRDVLQANLLGALSVLLVDRQCRKPFIKAEPGCSVLLQMCRELEGYRDKIWAAGRRAAASRCVTSLMQRDHEARLALVNNGGVAEVLQLLDAKGPGHEVVQYSMASLLATLVLDDNTMERLAERGEAPLLFQACLKLLSITMAQLKLALATDGVPQGENLLVAEGAEQQQQGQKQDTDIGGVNINRSSSTGTACDRQEDGNSRVSAGSTTGAKEALNVQQAVSLAEACSQGVWGSAHYCLKEPLEISQDQVIELGKLGLDCLIIGEADLGCVCHCLAATLATLAAHHISAGYMMAAAEDSVLRSVLALMEVEEGTGFSHAGHVRAAACTCVAFLACHPLGVKGDACLDGPHRPKLLELGAFGALLKAALASSSDPDSKNIIQQSAAVGVMYMSTMAGAVDAAELAMYSALMTSNTNIGMVEYLMAGMWILLKHPDNRKVLGTAFQANPAANRLVQGMVNKIQDTIDVADVSEQAEKIAKMNPPGTSMLKSALKASSSRASAARTPMYTQTGSRLGGAAPSSATSTWAGAADQPEVDKATVGGWPDHWKRSPESSRVSPAGMQGGLCGSVSIKETPRRHDEHDYTVMAAKTTTLEEKLQVVENKRRSVLRQQLVGDEETGLTIEGSLDGCASEAVLSARGKLCLLEINELENSDRPASSHALTGLKSLDKDVQSSIDNVEAELGSELQEDWGLETLVRVGETWLPKMLEGSSRLLQAGMTITTDDSRRGSAIAQPDTADVPLLKLFEFLTASLCLYVIDEDPLSICSKREWGVFTQARSKGTGWWTIAASIPQPTPLLNPLLERTMTILLTIIRLNMPAAWKSVQLGVVMLWNAALQSASVEQYQVEQGVCGMLLSLVHSSIWPASLRDIAAGHLQYLLETHGNLVALGVEYQQLRDKQEQEHRQQGQWQQQQQRGHQRSNGTLSGASSLSGVVTASGDGSRSSSKGHHRGRVSPKQMNNASGTPGIDLAAILGPNHPMLKQHRAHVAASASRAQPAFEQPLGPEEEAKQAAGAHPGWVPFLRSMIGLIETRHPLLELRGARGIGRLCYAAPAGGNAAQLLHEVKTCAANLGALGSLVDMLRRTAARYLLMEEGQVLPPPPNISELADSDYHVYERDLNNIEGVLQLLDAALSALLNLSVMRANQPKLAKVGLLTLLSANTSLYDHICKKATTCPEELKLLDMLAATIQNLASHPNNRTRLYKAELQGAAALDRVLEGPVSPEPCDTSSSLLATRAPGSLRRGGSFGRLSASPPPALPSLSGSSKNTSGGPLEFVSMAGKATAVSSVGGGRSSDAAGQRGSSPTAGFAQRSSSPATGVGLRGSSPAAAAAERNGTTGVGKRCSSSLAGALATGQGTGLCPPTSAATSRNSMLMTSIDSALSAASVLRPKVLLPPITQIAFEAADRSSTDQIAASWGTLADSEGPVNQDALASALKKAGRPNDATSPGPLSFSALQSQGVSSQSPKSIAALRSVKSRAATSTWGSPGNPIAPPDSKEQFLIWIDSTFNDHNDQQEGGSEAGGPGGGAGGVVVRTARRMLWDEQGEWLDVEPETSKGLHRLLCRPLSHLWQETLESRARAGKGRWSPSVSEYREMTGGFPLTHAASQLLTAGAPAEVTTLTTAAEQLAVYGRCDDGTVTWERPSTQERSQGRVPMAVLQPKPEYYPLNAVQGAAPVAPAIESDGGVKVDQHVQGEGDQSARTNQSSQQQQHLSGRSRKAEKACLPFKVAMSPQHARTTISFENKVWPEDGAMARPTLTLFEHTQGAKVSEGLFTEYVLPNGKKAFMYYNGGGIMDEAEVAPVVPPPRPTTVPLALQQSMPLGEVLAMIAKPPGSSPPFVPYKPVPRLVPLPASHTLKVQRPDILEAWAFGQLREDHLQLVLTAQSILQTRHDVTEEDIHLPTTEQRDPWTLPQSIFKARSKESDARAFYDGGATIDKMFERDWARACSKEKFTSMLSRENKANAAGKSDEVAMQEVHDVLQKHYQAFFSAFVYYAAGGNDPYHMPLNAFTSFLDDTAVPDPDSLSIKRCDCDTIFIVCNFQPDKKNPDALVNDEHAMMRFEFMECVVRLALAKYGKGQATDDLAEAVELLFERNITPRLCPRALLASNDFRTERLYTEEVDLLLKKHQNMLRALYSRYRLKPTGGGLRRKMLHLDGWLALMNDAHLIDTQFPLFDAELCYLWSRMYVVDEIKDYNRYTSLTFIDFVEALGRVADAKSLPTASDLDAAGFPTILEWALDKERMEGSGGAGGSSSAGAAATANTDGSSNNNGGALASSSTTAPEGRMSATGAAAGGGNLPDIFRPRPSARFGAPKPRPLYPKLDMLLELLMRRLFWDPAQPESVFSVDGLIKIIKKIDKDLGP